MEKKYGKTKQCFGYNLVGPQPELYRKTRLVDVANFRAIPSFALVEHRRTVIKPGILRNLEGILF